MTVSSVDFYTAEFARLNEARAGREASWLREIREQAFARFTALGFPTTRQEEWRFTNVAPIVAHEFRPAEEGADHLRADDLSAFRFAGAIEIVFVNGRFAPHLSSGGELPAGVSIASLADILGGDSGTAAGPDMVARHLGRHARFDDQPFTALNTALANDGAYVEVAPNAVVDRPLHVVFVSTSGGIVSYPRLLVVLRRNSQMKLVESHVGPGRSPKVEGAKLRPYGQEDAYFTNAVGEFVLEDDAVLDHYRVQRDSPEAFHVGTTQAHLSRGSSYWSHAFTFGGAIVRHDVNAVLDGEGADCTLNGLYLVDGTRLADTHTVIDHAQPHGTSHEVYKGILDGRARAVFNGKIVVRPDAQKTDAKQTNKTLLLSDDAQIDTKPQLMIHANDVKCTHGATVGQLNADAIFYLQARGIDRRAAEQMLVRAFAADITARVKIDALRERLEEVLGGALAADSAKTSREEAA